MIGPFEGQYRFLSNFWPAKVQFEGIIYESVEHAYQAAKTLDQDERLIIANLKAAADIVATVGILHGIIIKTIRLNALPMLLICRLPFMLNPLNPFKTPSCR